MVVGSIVVVVAVVVVGSIGSVVVVVARIVRRALAPAPAVAEARLVMTDRFPGAAPAGTVMEKSSVRGYTAPV